MTDSINHDGVNHCAAAIKSTNSRLPWTMGSILFSSAGKTEHQTAATSPVDRSHKDRFDDELSAGLPSERPVIYPSIVKHSHSPLILQHFDFLTATQCRDLITLGMPRLKQATVGICRRSARVSSSRTARTATFPPQSKA